jgi:hypothetical protein
MLVNASAWADGSTLTIDPFTIEPGATKQVAIKLVKAGDDAVIGFQCNVELPAGLSITLDEDEEPNVSAISGTVKSSKANIIVNYSVASGTLLVYNDKNSPYKDDAEGVVLFEFKASDNFAGGVIALKNIVLSLSGNVKVTADDVSAQVSTGSVVPSTFAINVAPVANGTVTLDKTSAAEGETVKITATPAEGYQLLSKAAIVVKAGDDVIALADDFTFTMPAADVTITVTFASVQVIPAGPSLIIRDFDIPANETKTVQIELIQGADEIIGFQCKIDLPQGLSVTLDEDEEPNATAVAGTVKSSKANVIVNYSVTSGTLLVYNDKNSPYKADATAVVELELKADATFESGIITIDDITFSKAGNVKETASATKTRVNPAIGIADMKAATSSDIYTISGTRVRTMTRGLYIVNGKKVVVK